MADQAPQTPAPFNEDALASRVRTEVQGALNDYAHRAQQAQAQQVQVQQQRQVQQQAAQDPIHNAVIKPYVEPVMRQVALQSQSALDAVTFYNLHKDAQPYTQQIEERFNQAAQMGMPLRRQDLWDHYKGQNFDHFVKAQQDEVTRAAAQGATIGAPGVGRAAGLPVLDREAARNLPFEDLERIVKTQAF